MQINPSLNVKTARAEFWGGCRAITPLVVGAIPFGIIFGSLAASSGLSFWGTLAMSAFVFAGASQFIALGLLSSGTALPLIILTTFVVNLRHLLYAVTLVPHVRHLPQAWKLPISFWLTDEAFAAAIGRYNQPDASPYKHWYYLGAALFMYINWQLCTWIGLTLGRSIPDAASWGLDFAMSVTFIGMIIPYLIDRPMIAAVCVAGLVSLLAHGLPHQLGLMLAAVCGILAGIVLEQKSTETL
ncbi:MAG: AzlC family ABC transporter permease [Pegethrix bostrychoides GSE-TBD4-15B]|jgi:4-azaleucine resistance transporter AzlC|uniref:AzlC family ABC transporter permease n=1 Tax=Pegethrix bostrychoides GSE-TBD4-15B TaxID=2839662 RepID=A0A951PBR0_9CYAN|nr:AzlC family ABC transporter permease [Pegethrix bostrychoides GSE-TBD4-15B]